MGAGRHAENLSPWAWLHAFLWCCCRWMILQSTAQLLMQSVPLVSYASTNQASYQMFTHVSFTCFS